MRTKKQLFLLAFTCGFAAAAYAQPGRNATPARGQSANHGAGIQQLAGEAVSPNQWAYYRVVYDVDTAAAMQKQQLWFNRDADGLRFTRWGLELPHPATVDYPDAATLTNVLATPRRYVVVADGAATVVPEADRTAIDDALAAEERAKEDARQGRKDAQLQLAEKRLVAFLKDNGFVDPDARKVRDNDLHKMYNDFRKNFGTTNEFLAARYTVLVRHVELLGGTETDLYDHAE